MSLTSRRSGEKASGHARTRQSGQLIDLLAAHPVIDAATIARHTGIHPNNVRRSIAPLVDAGILIGLQHYKSHRFLYRAPAMLELLDDYSAEVGRRQR